MCGPVQAYRAMGRYEKAVADFSQTIDLAPDTDPAIAVRGEAYRRTGR